MTTVSYVRDVVAMIVKAKQVVEAALSIVARGGRVKWRNAFTKLVCLLHSAMLHARWEGIFIILVVFQFDFVCKNALPLFDRQLAGVVGRVCLLHRNKEVDGVSNVEEECWAEIMTCHFCLRMDKNVWGLCWDDRQCPLFVGLKQVVDSVITNPF